MDTPTKGGRFASRTVFESLPVEEVESDQDDSFEDEQPKAEPVAKVTPRSAKKKAAKSEKTLVSKASDLAQAVVKPIVQVTDQSTEPTTSDQTAPASNGSTNGTSTPALSKQEAPAETMSTVAKPMQATTTAPDQNHLTVPGSAAKTSGSFQREPEKKTKYASSRPQLKQYVSHDADAAEAHKIKMKKIYERTLFTLIMIAGFVGLLLLGHPYVILLVLVSQTLVYREVVALFNIPGRPSVTGAGRSSRMSSAPTSAATSEIDDDEDERIIRRAEGRREELWSKTLSWYFFAVSNYFLYGESIIYYFKHIVFVDAYFIPFARHHRFLSFMLYVFGFMAFVSNLKRQNLKHQFGLFCWVHMSLLLIVFSSHFIVNNILEGLIWIWVPASLVICNDVFAYICGMTFGKTPLIALSPKKTVEGFVGAFIVTEIFAYGWATYFQRFNYMICPAVSLGMNAFKEITCEPNPVFVWRSVSLPPAVASLASSLVGHRVSALPWTPFQLHALVMAAFASLVAPFGGFFASGFKRAFNIKDFGDSIPGHGGLTDRMDCQFLMGLFSYVYYSSLVREYNVTVGSVLQTVVTQLTLDDQMELYNEISRYLVGQGKLAATHH